MIKLFTGMKFKLNIFGNGKREIFACQLSDNSLKVAKFVIGASGKRELDSCEISPISTLSEDKKLTEHIIEVFKKLGYQNGEIIVSLPRSKATCRYVKVPSHSPEEISRIVSLQAARYLPFPANELITGYQVISTDKSGYSDINLAIAHKDVITRYNSIFSALKPRKLAIVLSSYGLANFFDNLVPGYKEPAAIIDIDSNQAELAVIYKGRLLFSRYFKVNRTIPNWENIFISEINKSREASIKEASLDGEAKIFLTGSVKTCPEFLQALKKLPGLEAEILNSEMFKLPESILISGESFSGVIGLGLADLDEYLNLLPSDIKIEAQKLVKQKDLWRTVLFSAAIILVISLAVAKNMDNKVIYLKKLKEKLNTVAKDARPLEEIDKRVKFASSGLKKKPSALDVLYELHKIMPSHMTLASLGYEDAKVVTLRGQAEALDAVFNLVSQLESSAAFKNFNIKVRYATKRRTSAGETIDFEVACTKR